MKRIAFTCTYTWVAVGIYCLTDALALNVTTPECRHSGETWTETVSVPCSSPAVLDGSDHYCAMLFQSDHTEAVLISSGDVQTVQEGTRGSLSVGFTALGTNSVQTANITWRQTNWGGGLYHAPYASLGQINVVGAGMPCPGSGGGGTAPRPQEIFGSYDRGFGTYAPLDISLGDLLADPGSVVAAAYWMVPPESIDDVTVTLASPSPSVISLPVQTDRLWNKYNLESLGAFFIQRAPLVTNQEDTELVFTARTSTGLQGEVRIPLRIELMLEFVSVPLLRGTLIPVPYEPIQVWR